MEKKLKEVTYSVKVYSNLLFIYIIIQIIKENVFLIDQINKKFTNNIQIINIRIINSAKNLIASRVFESIIYLVLINQKFVKSHKYNLKI